MVHLDEMSTSPMVQPTTVYGTGESTGIRNGVLVNDRNNGHAMRAYTIFKVNRNGYAQDDTTINPDMEFDLQLQEGGIAAGADNVGTSEEAEYIDKIEADQWYVNIYTKHAITDDNRLALASLDDELGVDINLDGLEDEELDKCQQCSAT
ncbi:hypothetical protein A3Q56_08080 [Intoshia linei]|uniref:Uncharacterized protein n=1 Tax=Intoshia linei TaxID=1819745 RepID=A0A177AQD7_9BILA|nr:hypothetical protein A3Q56_08080 [Intoshia linei]